MHFHFYTIFIYIGSISVFNEIISAQDISSQFAQQNVICSLSTNCSSCISHPECSWCPSQEIITGASRCDLNDNLLANGCPHKEIVNPASSVETIKDDIQLESSKSPIQLHPQRIQLHIRKNDVQRFPIKFEQALDYPIDLYYLMDLTHSMKEHKEKLVELADSLAANMFNITKKFRLGFGSFIDKVVMPYANMVPAKLVNPCVDKIKCESPYGFRNHLPLNENITQFSNEVSATPLSGNLDNAEGGFDAIMQVIVCRDHIKWNNLSRKIILFATDSIFHYAGDGKLGGIVKPNDGKCHLSPEGYYTESILQDYPSLEQISRKMINSKMNIIFAVTDNSINVYKQLSEEIPGSRYGVLKDDSSNIVDIVRENFEKIASRVEMTDNSSDAVQIRYISSCLNDHKSETKICHNIGTGKTIEFDVELKVIKCPPNGRETFRITPIGIEEYTVVDLHVMCECDCELEPLSKPNSTDCSDFGTYACGMCECNTNRFGKRCECDGDDAIRQDKIDQCKRNQNATILCSNRGDCVCGECQCHSRQNSGEIISGKFCECDTFSCSRDINGLSCGGPYKGFCCDGECHCASGWSGPVCDCSTINATCISSAQFDKLCSGRGDCRCGRCRCEDGYYGEYCQDCASCEARCNELQLCVECQIFKAGMYSPVECRDKCEFTYETVQSLEYEESARQCIFFDREGCRITFDYDYKGDNELYIRVLEERDCPAIFNAFVAVGSITLTVFLIGLIVLLIFRLFIWYKDKKEYERFLIDVNRSKSVLELKGQNPLFKSAQTQHINPMYGSAN